MLCFCSSTSGVIMPNAIPAFLCDHGTGARDFTTATSPTDASWSRRENGPAGQQSAVLSKTKTKTLHVVLAVCAGWSRGLVAKWRGGTTRHAVAQAASLARSCAHVVVRTSQREAWDGSAACSGARYSVIQPIILSMRTPPLPSCSFMRSCLIALRAQSCLHSAPLGVSHPDPLVRGMASRQTRLRAPPRPRAGRR